MPSLAASFPTDFIYKKPLTFYPIYPTGRPLFFDDFDIDPLKWSKFIIGGGNATRLTAMAYQGSGCCNLTTGATANDEIEICKQIGRLPKNRVGIEFVFRLNVFHTIGDLGVFQFGTERRGDTVKSAYLYYDPDYGGVARFQFADAVTGYNALISFPSGKPLALGGFEAWYPFKLVVDFDNAKWVCAIFNNLLFDLSDRSLKTWSSTEQWSDYLAFFWLKNGTTAKAQDLRIDNVLVTYDEPSLPQIAETLGLTVQKPPVTLVPT